MKQLILVTLSLLGLGCGSGADFGVTGQVRDGQFSGNATLQTHDVIGTATVTNGTLSGGFTVQTPLGTFIYPAP